MENENEKQAKLQHEIATLKEEKSVELALEGFLKFVNKEPNIKNLPTRKLFGAGKSEMSYMPISRIEAMLDTFYFGMWSTVNFEYKQVMNEITGSIQLRVKHPITGDWLERTGAASCVIRQASKTEILQIAEHKIKDALVMDIPHLKSECIKNAAKLLGAAFGRNVGRDIIDAYTPIITQVVETKEKKAAAGDKIALEVGSDLWKEVLRKKTDLKTVKFHYDFLNEEDEKTYVAQLKLVK